MKTPALAALVLGSATVVAPATAATAAELFGDNCAQCHGVDGKARTPAGRKFGAKDLSQSKLDDAAIVKQIENGTKSGSSEKMPPFKAKLSADEIQALAAYVKTFRR